MKTDLNTVWDVAMFFTTLLLARGSYADTLQKR